MPYVLTLTTDAPDSPSEVEIYPTLFTDFDEALRAARLCAERFTEPLLYSNILTPEDLECLGVGGTYVANGSRPGGGAFLVYTARVHARAIDDFGLTPDDSPAPAVTVALTPDDSTELAKMLASRGPSSLKDRLLAALETLTDSAD